MMYKREKMQQGGKGEDEEEGEIGSFGNVKWLSWHQAVSAVVG